VDIITSWCNRPASNFFSKSGYSSQFHTDPLMDLTLSQFIPVKTLIRPSCTTSTYTVQLPTFTSDKQTLILTFIFPFIASISLKYNQQDATFSRSIYFYKLLYMFQAVPPPHHHQKHRTVQTSGIVKPILLPAAAGSSIGLTIPDVACIVLCS
jgi:hypothetical protein